MNYFSSLILSLTFFFSLTNNASDSQITGLIIYNNSNIDIPITVKLWRHNPPGYTGELIQETKESESSFSFDVEPGKYTFGIYSSGTAIDVAYIYIPNNKTNIEIQISPESRIKADIARVRICGAFCGWDGHQGIDLKKKGYIWELEDHSILTKGEPYEFIIDDEEIEVEDIHNNSIYIGEKITFNPSLYFSEIEYGISNISGYDLHEEYNNLWDSLNGINSNINKLMGGKRTLNTKQWKNEYNIIVMQYDSLMRHTPIELRQAIVERQIFFNSYFHPISQELFKYGKPDSITIRKLEKSEIVKDYFTRNLSLFEQLDPKSYLIDPNFATSLFMIESMNQYFPSISEKINFDEDYIYNYIVEFVNQSPNRALCQKILVDAVQQFSHRNKIEKASKLINILKKEYSDAPFVKRGEAERLLDEMNKHIGIEAPLFKLQTLGGDSLKLSDYRGKFVFLDFWGSWCAPCLEELPNLIRLTETISNKKIQLIGMVYDEYERISKYLTDNPLPYPNLMTNEDILIRYEINSYPTTFLIDPEGKIIAKNLRGEKLVEIVKQKMNEYGELKQ